MAGETDQTLLSISDTAASIGKVASGAESDTAPTSSSSNFTAEKIVKKDVPMLFEYWRESTVTEADRAAYHAAGWLPGGVESSMSDLEFPMVDNTTIVYFESHLIPGLCNVPEVLTLHFYPVELIQIPKFYLNSIQIQNSDMYLNFGSNSVAI
jgi:hypothetical protein